MLLTNAKEAVFIDFLSKSDVFCDKLLKHLVFFPSVLLHIETFDIDADTLADVDIDGLMSQIQTFTEKLSQINKKIHKAVPVSALSH
jgi:hypothetical protein